MMNKSETKTQKRWIDQRYIGQDKNGKSIYTPIYEEITLTIEKDYQIEKEYKPMEIKSPSEMQAVTMYNATPFDEPKEETKIAIQEMFEREVIINNGLICSDILSRNLRANHSDKIVYDFLKCWRWFSHEFQQKGWHVEMATDDLTRPNVALMHIWARVTPNPVS